MSSWIGLSNPSRLEDSVDVKWEVKPSSFKGSRVSSTGRGPDTRVDVRSKRHPRRASAGVRSLQLIDEQPARSAINVLDALCTRIALPNLVLPRLLTAETTNKIDAAVFFLVDLSCTVQEIAAVMEGTY
jgi:hypothetical protein